MPTTLTIILVLSCVLEDYNIHISSLNRKLKYQMMALCHTYLRKKNWLPIPLVSHSKNWLDPNSLVIYNHIYRIRSYFYNLIIENTDNQLICYLSMCLYINDIVFWIVRLFGKMIKLEFYAHILIVWHHLQCFMACNSNYSWSSHMTF